MLITSRSNRCRVSGTRYIAFLFATMVASAARAGAALVRAAWSVSLMMALAVLADGRVGGRRCPPCRPRRQRAEFLLAASILAVLPIISALPALAQSGGIGGTGSTCCVTPEPVGLAVLATLVTLETTALRGTTAAAVVVEAREVVLGALVGTGFTGGEGGGGGGAEATTAQSCLHRATQTQRQLPGR